jgi:type IV secretion system protein VirB1
MVIDLPQYIHQCASHVAENTMMAIIKTESNGNPLAIGLNRGYKLLYQPRDYNQAREWVNYLEAHGYNFDIGIAQVNIKNIHKFGYKATDALNPCINLRIGSDIIQKNYLNALPSSKNQQEALYKAISSYNTGNNQSGFYNGYVKKVVYNANGRVPYIPPSKVIHHHFNKLKRPTIKAWGYY